MLDILLKIFIMFILTIGLMRLMGKSTIIQLTPYDLVAIFIIGTVAAEPLITTEFIPTIIRVVAVVVFYLIFAKLTLNQTMNKFFLGEPSILIKHGKIIEDNLEKEHLSLMQLISILRTTGYSKLTEIDFAILEPTGSVSVIPVPSARPATLGDLDIEAKYEGVPMAIIIDGIIQKRNLQLVNRDEEWLQEKLQEKGIDNIKEIIYAFVDDQNDELYLNYRNPVDEASRKNNQVQRDKEIKEQKSEQGNLDNKELIRDKRKIYLVQNHKIQTKGLREAHISKSELEEWLGVDDFTEINEVVIEQEIKVKSN
ncbi:MAG: hypothetical protein AWU54_276 [Candidatus Frackibacter sp. T328-2]|nr:MAG: hypothetical protein AWU54_276 [Candidatus Frackibacter sp. T328-2]